MAKKIRLTESDLHNLVERAVMNVLENEELNEGWKDYFRSIGHDAKNAAQTAYDTAYNKVGNATNAFKQGVNNTVDKMKQGYNNAKQGVSDTIDKVKQGMSDMHKRAMDASAIGDIPSAIKTLDNVRQRGLIQGRNLAMINGAITILNNIYTQMKQGQA